MVHKHQNECERLWWGCFYRKLTIDVAKKIKIIKNETRTTAQPIPEIRREGDVGFGRHDKLCSWIRLNRHQIPFYMRVWNEHHYKCVDVLAMTYSRGKENFRGEISSYIFSSAECFAWIRKKQQKEQMCWVYGQCACPCAYIDANPMESVSV